MAQVITGAGGSIAYFNAKPKPRAVPVFDATGGFHADAQRGFAGLSAFAANGNHAPTDFDGAVTWDAGVDLLFRIAGAH
ncbi:hypothetical protein Z946_2993 [Sulfitobacter noctilucicola]|uniref:Uncharacterized protein n=1 Tax=Sulfitobacter noctilucicola TaxID=1342301 RepID=A0A7W6Q4M5_9RHOB|nr:hypothetical protein [Sulfitobacter noctilucicola]KIN64106.1 hypothetical protein Z946_2993 [Sulfitobacter noctilucicola]MBB4175460.1 hypothetical protein [Sulfitobacter noctilucicola]